MGGYYLQKNVAIRPLPYYNVTAMVMTLTVMSRRRPALLGIFLLIALFLKPDAARASEAFPVISYIDHLEDSIFNNVVENISSERVPPYVIKKVDLYVRFFTTSGRNLFQGWLDQSMPYIPLIKEILREEGIPEDIAFLPLIESGFNLNAKSPAKATGLWQFMATTGALYGLKMNNWVDERKDPVKSTKAAARHLKDLYETFGSWPLALASYNAGSGKIKRALNRTGSSTFWEIGQGRVLKKETMDYIPKFMAAMIIARNPEAFGFTLSEGPAFKYDLLHVPGGMDIHMVAKNSNVDYDLLRSLNPELKSHITSFDEPYYILRLSEGTGEIFIENFENLLPSERIVYREYKVKIGDSVYKIAKRHDTTVSAIREANKLNNRLKIVAGKTILVPIRLPYSEDAVKITQFNPSTV